MNILNNIPQVTRNLLILNVLMFLVTLYFQSQNIDLYSILGMHYLNSPLFEPYQLISHIFMHADIMHLFFNMFGLVMFGGFLERLWGPRRFFFFYMASAVGALLLYNSIGVIELMELKRQLAAAGSLGELDKFIREFPTLRMAAEQLSSTPLSNLETRYLLESYSTMFGASGAVFGVMSGFAILFPNTEMYIYFIPIPIKAKYLIGGYFVYELYRSIYQEAGDNVAHLAHVGGAVIGAIIVLYWRRKSKNFY